MSATEDAKAFLSQAEFARRRGVSRKAVTAWKQKGLLVLDDGGLVDVDRTEWALDQRPAKHRGGVTHRPVRAVQGNSPGATKVATGKASGPAVSSAKSRPSDRPEGDEEDKLDLTGETLTLAEAARRKENYLGLLRKQEYERGGGALVDRAAAERLFFEAARDLRDAWLAWPARVSVTMADELAIDARVLTTVLTRHVQQHLAELGEPHADLA